MDDYFKESFGDDIAYRICNPAIRDQFLSIINRLYGVRDNNGATSSFKRRGDNAEELRFPGAQPCSIMRKDLERIAQDHYVVAQKTDGTRYLLLLVSVGDQQFCVMCDRKVTMWLVDLKFAPEVHANETLFDGELVRNELENRYLFEVFDLVSSGQNARSTNSYIVRMNNAKDIIERCHKHEPPHGQRYPFQIKVKRYWPTHKIDQLTCSTRMHQGCRCDGLVFTPVKLFVKPYRNNYMFKWKDQHTIDPLVRYNAQSKASNNALKIAATQVDEEENVLDDDYNKPPSRLKRQNKKSTAAASSRGSNSDSGSADNSFDIDSFELWLKNTDDQLVFYQRVNPVLNRSFLEQHGMAIVAADAIVECEYDAHSNDWRLNFIRKDRGTPNTEYTVAKTLENIAESISLDEIVQVALQNKPNHPRNDGTHSQNRANSSQQAPPIRWASPFQNSGNSAQFKAQTTPSYMQNNTPYGGYVPYSPGGAQTFSPAPYHSPMPSEVPPYSPNSSTSMFGAGQYVGNNTGGAFVAPGYEPQIPGGWYPPQQTTVAAPYAHPMPTTALQNTLTAAELNRQRLEEQQRARLAQRLNGKFSVTKHASQQQPCFAATSVPQSTFGEFESVKSVSGNIATQEDEEEYDPCSNSGYSKSDPPPTAPKKDVSSLLAALANNLKQNPSGPLVAK
jgi:hypothetical protein